MIAVGLIIHSTVFVVRVKNIPAQWEGTSRHVVALMLGWVSLATLLSLFIALDLLESDRFAFITFADSLMPPLVILIAGMVVLSIILATSRQ